MPALHICDGSQRYIFQALVIHSPWWRSLLFIIAHVARESLAQIIWSPELFFQCLKHEWPKKHHGILLWPAGLTLETLSRISADNWHFCHWQHHCLCAPLFFQVDSESLRESNVREVLSQACTNFVGNLENQQDMASLVDEQMMLLRKCFKVPSELGDAGWIRVSKQLIQLYRTGKLGRYTLDLVPSDGHQKKLNICIVGSAPS